MREREIDDKRARIHTHIHTQTKNKHTYIHTYIHKHTHTYSDIHTYTYIQKNYAPMGNNILCNTFNLFTHSASYWHAVNSDMHAVSLYMITRPQLFCISAKISKSAPAHCLLTVHYMHSLRSADGGQEVSKNRVCHYQSHRLFGLKSVIMC